MPIWFVSKKIKPEKCITGDTLAPEKKALMITGDARGSQRVNKFVYMLFTKNRISQQTYRYLHSTDSIAPRIHGVTKNS